MTGLPAGTVTLLFSDIEGSTRLLLRLGIRYPAVLEEHRRVLGAAIVAAGGRLIDTQGDACFAVFSRAGEAVTAAAEIQRALAAHEWPTGVAVRVRIGLHTGEPTQTPGGYAGLDVHRAARLCSAGHGGQILLSSTTADLVEASPPPGTRLVELGSFRFKGFTFAERVCQLQVGGLQAEFPMLRTLDAASRLPGQHRSLVGRDAEINAGRRLLLDPATRLLTLTGPGGSGKTRLAVAIAAGLQDAFEDGVCFVPLAPVSDPSLVAAGIGQALGLRELSQRPTGEQLVDYLGMRELLLVLDNFEQVLDAAPLVAEIVDGCGRLKVLATSREPLHLTGERELVTGPLDLPPVSARAASRVYDYAAVRLFVERAREARRDFTLTDTDAPVVAEICRRLEGLPLSIELAAARIRYLAPSALLGRLDHRLALLTGGPRDLPARHQTLRATIAWSHDLLNDRDRTIFRRASVFVGGWTLEAAEAVCGFDLDPFELVDALTSLVDKSLLRRDESPVGEARFGMLDTIRELATEQLQASGEYEAVVRRHADYFLAFVREAEPYLAHGARQLEWLHRLDEEHENVQRVLDWCAADPDDPARAELGLQLGAALWRYWAVRSSAAQARARIEALLALAADGPPSLARGQALQGAGILARELTDYPAAQRFLEASLEIARQLGDRRRVADVLNSLGWLACFQGESARARAVLEESHAIFRDLGDTPWQAIVLSRLGYVCFLEGDAARSLELGEEALALARRVGDPLVVADSLVRLGVTYHYGGDLARARQLYEESLPVLRRQGDRHTSATALNLLGHVAILQGSYEEARRLLREGVLFSREVGNVRRLTFILSAIGALAAAVGAAEVAIRLDAASQSLSAAVGAVPARPARAHRDAEIDVARRRLGEAASAAAVAAGRALTLDQALDEALAWLGDDPAEDAEGGEERDRWLDSPWSVVGWGPGEVVTETTTEQPATPAGGGNGGLYLFGDGSSEPRR